MQLSVLIKGPHLLSACYKGTQQGTAHVWSRSNMARAVFITGTATHSLAHGGLGGHRHSIPGAAVPLVTCMSTAGREHSS